MPINDSSLISFWELGEASGTRNDSKGTNHLTDNNTVLQGTGKVGNCADFVAANSEYLSIADVSQTNLDVNGTNFTIAGWLNFDANGTNEDVWGKADGGEASYILARHSSNVFWWRVWGATGFSGGSSLTSSLTTSIATWYFVVCWYDGSNIYLQVNDGTAESTGHAGGTFDSSAPFLLGITVYGQPFGGLMDQVGFWRRTLTATERTFLYNGGAGRSYADLAESTPKTATFSDAWGNLADSRAARLTYRAPSTDAWGNLADGLTHLRTEQTTYTQSAYRWRNDDGTLGAPP
jgi:hypothetical protein